MNMRRLLPVAALLVCAAGVAGAQTEWVGDPEGPVIELGPEGAWDGERLPTAVVKVDGVYHMYYYGGWRGSEDIDYFEIGHATSTDGVSWELDPANPVLTRGADGEWDESLMDERFPEAGTAVIHDGSEFRMWYSGVQESSGIQRVGHATSPDGSTWTKHPGNPIIEPGLPGSFTDGSLAPQTVILEGERCRMWFLIRIDPSMSGRRIGYAESRDGLSWTEGARPSLDHRHGDSGSYTSFSIAFDGARYHMFYGDYGEGLINYIGYASSEDGFNWTRYPRASLVRHLLDTWYPTVIWDADGGTFEMWHVLLRERFGPIYRSTSVCCPTVHSWFIPAAAYGSGAHGTLFQTAVDLSNASDTAEEYRIAWLPRGETNREWIWSELRTLDPGASVRYDNVLAEVFDLAPRSFGGLVVEASSEDLLAMSRIFTSQGASGGAYGQAMPAVRLDDFAGHEERRRILFATENDEMRFNIGCQSAYEWPLDLQLEFCDDAGTLVRKRTMRLPPWGNDQLHQMLEAHRPVTGYVDVWTDGWGEFYCYGSLLDNDTNDPITIPPLEMRGE